MRERLLGGRIRTSTVILGLVFVVTLVAYLLVRPVPAAVTEAPPAEPGSTSRSAPARPSPSPTTTQAPQPGTPGPTATGARPDGAASATPSASDTGTSEGPSPTPGAAG